MVFELIEFHSEHHRYASLHNISQRKPAKPPVCIMRAASAPHTFDDRLRKKLQAQLSRSSIGR